MPIANVKFPICIIKWHDKRNMLNMQMIMFTENSNKSFAHISIDPTLDGVVDRRYLALYLEKDVEEPF